jgi:hypothetical protein
MFFWLIGTLVITKKRLMIFTWTLALCSVPLAATGVQHFLAGDFVTSRRAEVQRIAGYAGSGIASNPNDRIIMAAMISTREKPPGAAVCSFIVFQSVQEA